mmetsp:Transcript_28681/g.72012  ORF Transcript_28681/g.72012 Transcript_28681/m.72012 type:complete len:292 (+) Transcript_28681:348-1223(+)
MKRIVENNEVKIDYVIVETTGIADPLPIVNSLMSEDMEEYFRLDGILTLVDADNFDVETNMQSDVALNQIQIADTIILSKTDIASEEKTKEVIKFMQNVRYGARILRSQRGQIPLSLVLDVGTRVKSDHTHTHKKPVAAQPDPSSAAAANGDPVASPAPEDSTPCDDPDCADATHNHIERDGFMSTSFQISEPLDPRLFMEEFLQKLPPGVFRAKGLIFFEGYPQRYVFQLSGRRYQFEEDEWPEGKEPNTQLVVIGRELDLDELKVLLLASRASSLAAQGGEGEEAVLGG